MNACDVIVVGGSAAGLTVSHYRQTTRSGQKLTGASAR